MAKIAKSDLANVLIECLPNQGLVWVSSCSSESSLLAEAVMGAGDALGGLTFSGIFVPGLNRQTYLANDRCRVRTYFMTPELKAHPAQVEFLPSCYTDILGTLKADPPKAALVMVSPPDNKGQCSLGSECHFLGDIWKDIPVLIGHVNVNIPRTPGYSGIPITAFKHIIKEDSPLLSMAELSPAKVADEIAENVALLIPEKATLQLGLGKVPGSILRKLKSRSDIKLHSGLIGTDVLELLKTGALSTPGSVTVGVAIGTEKLYEALSNEVFDFQPVSITHDAETIANKAPFVSLNSTISVDLLGQAFSEVTHTGLMSGPGGASDFARGVKLAQSRGCQSSLRILAFPSTAGKAGQISRIVGPGQGLGPVSLGRMDTDIVVTEYGAADLRNKTYNARAESLIEIAAPKHKAGLSQAWGEYSSRL